MLKVITSKTTHKARELLIGEMRQNRTVGRTQLVIVPDRFGMSAESEVLRDLGIKGSFDIVVTSFLKLAKRLIGGEGKGILTAEGSVMLLARAILKTRDDLDVYRRASERSGFASELYAVIATIRKNRYSVEDLRAVLPKLPEYVRRKCADVVTVYEEYLKQLEGGKLDGSTLLEVLAREIPESDFIADADVYVTDFFSYTGEQKLVIEKLIDRAHSVTLCKIKGEGANARIYDTRDVEQLINYARAHGGVREIFVDAKLSPSRNLVADRLFSYKRGEQTTGGSGIKVYEAESVEGEIEHLARTILMLTKEGYRYRDVSVLAGNIDEIAPLVKRIFKAHAIPVFTDEKTVLKSTPVARFFLNCTTLSARTDTALVLSILKSAFSIVDESDARDFQRHVTRYSIERINVRKPIPLGLTAPTYEGAERARIYVESLLLDLKKTDSAKAYADEVIRFLDELRIKESTEKLNGEQEARGDVFESRRDSQAVDKLYGVFEQIIEVVGDVTLDYDEFINIVVSALDSIKISYAPMFVDSVYVGGAEKSRFCDCKAFFIVGAQAGVLPQSGTRVGILGENEERALKKCDVNLSPSAKESSAEEMLHVTQLLVMDKERLYVSYTPRKGHSDIVDELTGIFSDVTINNPYDLFDTDAEWLEYYASTKASALYSYTHRSCERYRQTIERALKIKATREKEWTIEDGATLFFPNSTTSVSQLGTYFTCPYKHFFSYGLRCKKDVEPNSPMVAGNFLHLLFERGVKKMSDLGYPDPKDKLYEDIEKEVLREVEETDEFTVFKNDGWGATLKRLKDEGARALREIIEHVRKSEYKPDSYEYKFGQDKPFYIKGEKVELKLVGKIDRIDRCSNKAILLDYKTGGAPDTLSDVYYGTGVQLALYMKALDDESVQSVGAFYYPIRDSYTKGDTERLMGNVVGGELSKFDADWIAGHSSDFVAVDYDKFGKLNTGSADVLCSGEELQAIKDYSVKVSQKAVDEICDGFIAPMPINKNKCKYCAYAPLCDGYKKERATRTIRKGAFIKEGKDEQMD